ncbi:MAG: hypothetical protein H6719_37000 [Sandaracinaceae bacterium]|nr:hypothetical protein [Sandaracinaceae bacterium]
MSRVGIVVCALIASFALATPGGACAQVRNTRGSTRRAGSRGGQASAHGGSVRERRGSRRSSRDDDDDDDDRYDDDDRRGGRRGYERTRRRRLVVDVSYDVSGCVYVEDGYCYYDEDVYVGASMISFGFSLDVLGGVFPTDPNGLSSRRLVSGDLDAGLFGTLGAGVRGWLLYDRLRLGVLGQVGAGLRTQTIELPADAVVEAGSTVGDGWWSGWYGFAAYQPQLSDLVQLWFGVRAGVSTFATTLEANGRRYGSLERAFFAAGPEIGLMLSGDGVGVMFWAFADLAQPGVAQLSIAFVYEEPKPQGSAF